MQKVYLGVDIGSISTKGVIIDAENRVLAQAYIWTEGSPVNAVKEMLRLVGKQLGGRAMIEAIGTTGSARKLIGTMLGAGVVKNEITAHAIGTLSRRPDARTILEIGGQDSKIILINDGIVVDYAMNTLCAAGTGSFLSAQAKRLGIPLEDVGPLALKSQNPVKIAARCAVFAESDMVHKAQVGHKKEDLVAGLCAAVVSNYLNNVGKGKSINPPVVFQGGVSKNTGVVRAFEDAIGLEVCVDEDSHLLGAVGAAILSKSAPLKSRFDFEMAEMDFITRGRECRGCSNRCEIVSFYRDGELLDSWGNRCPNGLAANVPENSRFKKAL